jgi:hypothetical protein
MLEHLQSGVGSYRDRVFCALFGLRKRAMSGYTHCCIGRDYMWTVAARSQLEK